MRKALALALLFLGCGKKTQAKPQAEPRGEALERVGEVTIYKEDLRVSLPSVGEFKLSGADSAALLESLKRVAAFYQAAKAEGLDTLPEVRRKLLWAQRAALAQEFLMRVLDTVKVSDAELSKYIKEHMPELSRQVNVMEVAVKEPALVDSIRKLLEDGSYASMRMLQWFSERGAVVVNPVGYVSVAALRFNLPPDAAKALKEAKVGQVVGPFPSPTGFMVLMKVVDQRQVKPDTAAIKPALGQALLAERQAKVIDSLFGYWLAKLKGGK